MSNLQQNSQWLMENGYLIRLQGKWKLTQKFIRDMKEISASTLLPQTPSQSLPMSTELSSIPTDVPALIPELQTDWTQRYSIFIVQAKVPQRGEGRSGSYDLNKYTEEGKEAFRKAVEVEGIDYNILEKATLLYYHTHKKFAVNIGNYMTKGMWRTDYIALRDSVQQGTAETHIKNELDASTDFSRYRLG